MTCAISLWSKPCDGGLLGLVAYIAIFSRSFGAIGKARKKVEGDRGREWFLWCLGSALFSVVVAHFGINYPAMMEIGLFTFWTLISVATFEAEAGDGPNDGRRRPTSSSHPLLAQRGFIYPTANQRKQQQHICFAAS